ncbi:hypothetical protein [Planctomyces sp. SH-PL14]|uniref:hypothetical protein n=1 Tax=Planctomyces sp. SH-PL14 TaxID=1632864 RepID=UPI00078C7066|nr:hypothetical protein [Planctomyces sp. SH-PL14]AMV19862.1 hypothetical protein VT03_18335 [Planctomyces sp. SH-PL14]
MTSEQEFREAYDKLSAIDKCDHPVGREYQRVLKEWLSLGGPRPIEQFIVTRVNADSSGRGRKVLN